MTPSSSEKDETNIKGIIFNIQRYSISDGPGIRTTVFLKGCPLNCLWCSNPESQRGYPEVAHSDSLCIKCKRCIEICEPKAISLGGKGTHIDRKLCTNCGKCLEVCTSDALKIHGKYMSVTEVFEQIEKDLLYYKNTGGGVTASGGEPLFQPLFTAALFKTCREAGIDTSLETCGYADEAALRQVLQYTSLVLFDFKHFDPDTHLKLTGKSNERILANLKLTLNTKIPLIVRIPLIPGLNDSNDELMSICRIFKEMNASIKINLLPYHKFGTGKYQMLDRQYTLNELTVQTNEEIQRAKAVFDKSNIDVEVVE
jgi:pyruvate formate lyase activating enzyme